MAARYSVRSGKVSLALATATSKTLILLNPATDGLSVIEAWVSFGATVSQTDIAVELVRVVTIGTPAGTTGTVVKDNPNSAASSVTALTSLTTEPTTYEILRDAYLTVQGGLVIVQFPLGREPFAAPAGQRMGLRVTNDGSGTMTSVDARAVLVYEEE